MDIARPIEIEPASNRLFIHPFAARLLPTAIRAGLHPNLVTGTGLGFGLLAGLAYLHWTDWRFATVGFVLMIGWHVMDGLDGQLARATGKTSEIGRLLDGVADYSAFVAVNLAIALTCPDPRTAVGLALAAGVCHALQSQFYEGERATYIRRIRGQFTAVRRSAAGGLVERIYNRGEALLGNRERALDAALASAAPVEQHAILERWRPQAARAFRFMAPLSANGRTLAIWVTALFQVPMVYWLWEIFALTLLALACARALRQAESRAITSR